MAELSLSYISIIIPVLNGEGLIGTCLESIERLNYPKDNFEVIIVDNGSTDRTVEIVRDYQDNDLDIKLYIEKIKGSYTARNLGIKNANGDIIAFTDIDCIVDKDWLVNIAIHFSDKAVGGIAGEILPGNGNSLVERYTVMSGILSQKTTLNSSFLPYGVTANVAYKKELFRQIGYFDDVGSGGDADFAWRMQLETNYKLVYAQDAIVFHKHRTSLKGLFRQTFRYGYGYRMLQEKYKDNFNTKNSPTDKPASNHKMINILRRYGKDDGLLILPILMDAGGYILGQLYANYIINISKLSSRIKV